MMAICFGRYPPSRKNVANKKLFDVPLERYLNIPKRDRFFAVCGKDNLSIRVYNVQCARSAQSNQLMRDRLVLCLQERRARLGAADPNRRLCRASLPRSVFWPIEYFPP